MIVPIIIVIISLSLIGFGMLATGGGLFLAYSIASKAHNTKLANKPVKPKTERAMKASQVPLTKKAPSTTPPSILATLTTPTTKSPTTSLTSSTAPTIVLKNPPTLPTTAPTAPTPPKNTSQTTTPLHTIFYHCNIRITESHTKASTPTPWTANIQTCETTMDEFGNLCGPARRVRHILAPMITVIPMQDLKILALVATKTVGKRKLVLNAKDYYYEIKGKQLRTSTLLGTAKATNHLININDAQSVAQIDRP